MIGVSVSQHPQNPLCGLSRPLSEEARARRCMGKRRRRRHWVVLIWPPDVGRPRLGKRGLRIEITGYWEHVDLGWQHVRPPI